jgi:hypothetical protein
MTDDDGRTKHLFPMVVLADKRLIRFTRALRLTEA